METAFYLTKFDIYITPKASWTLHVHNPSLGPVSPM